MRGGRAAHEACARLQRAERGPAAAGLGEMAIENDLTLTRNAIIASAPSVNPAINAGNITISPANCVAGATVTVTISYSVSLLTGFFGAQLPLSSEGVMRCGG